MIAAATASGRAAAAAATAGSAMIAFAWLLGALRRFEESRTAGEGVPWWFGYARDGVNLGAGLLLLGTFALAGYSGPAAMLLATALWFATYTLDAATGKWLRLRGASALSGAFSSVAAVLLAMAAGGTLGESLGALLRAATPR